MVADATCSTMRALSRAGPVVVFDLDGTLVDSALGIAAALNRLGVAREPVSVDAVRALVSFGAERLVGEALKLPAHEVAGALASFRAVYALDPCTRDDGFPGVFDALSALAASGLALGVCTNKPQGLAEIVIDRLGLSALLPVIVGSAPSRPSKPDAQPLLETIARLAQGDGQAVLVGDSVVDALTAQAAHVPFIYATFGYSAISDAVASDACFDRYADLPPLIEELFSRLPHGA